MNGTKQNNKEKNYFRFTAVEDTGFMLQGIDLSNGNQTTPDVNIEISTDGITWNTWDFQPTELLASETVYMRGNNPDGFSKLNLDENTGICHMFMFGDGKIECHGNIMSLLYGYGFEDKYTIPRDCCFFGLFRGCTSLTTAPELPATTLSAYCYYYMFGDCTSLTTAPELPATTLTTCCYAVMFMSCSSLTTAPELPATTLANDCYSSMFAACTNLSEITMLATDISADGCLYYWVGGVASTGILNKNPNMNDLPTATEDNYYSGIPEGWTVVDYQE